MADSYDLTKLDPNTFEHLVNALALSVLGSGHTGFGPGRDGGRDGYFEGEALYPSDKKCWNGVWYIQSKFHKPHLSNDPQQWLLQQIESELSAFDDSNKKRLWPNNWIVATNIDPSGAPETGSFDKAHKLVEKVRPELAGRFHIWGGAKIIQLLDKYPYVGTRYKEFLTPGHIIQAILEYMGEDRASAEAVLRHLIAYELGEQRFARLDQAGDDGRLFIHEAYVDLPFRAGEQSSLGSGENAEGHLLQQLVRTAAQRHIAGDSVQSDIDTSSPLIDNPEWRNWNCRPHRARAWLVKGGPGQGKSTLGQCFCQIQRAALLLANKDIPARTEIRSFAESIKTWAEKAGWWPSVPRIPLVIELKEYAEWYAKQDKNSRRGVLSFVASKLENRLEQPVPVGLLKKILGDGHAWVAVFDGLDEVPSDVRDNLCKSVRDFVDDVAVEQKLDILTICTSRPQGYVGQFDELSGVVSITLSLLPPNIALDCARPVLARGQTNAEYNKSIEILKKALTEEEGAVQELMTTPLQAHIMAVVVRGGIQPPNRRWKLFHQFYDVIYKREKNRDLPDKRIASLLRDDEALVKTVHARLGFLLHARAERAEGAHASLSKNEFRSMLERAVQQVRGDNYSEIVEDLMRATTERLVLVSTPDTGDYVRFDIRQLQEYFAAEFLYEEVDTAQIGERLATIAGDVHWQEVTFFLLSALAEQGRTPELQQAASVLTDLNEDTESTDIVCQNTAHRLARGAYYVARLLKEGVLEGDARLRKRFEPVLTPYLSTVNIETVAQLRYLRHSNSRRWLTDLSIQSLQKFQQSENIGAAYLLPYLLSEDSRVSGVKQYLLDNAPGYLNLFLNSLSIEELNNWALDSIIDILTNNELLYKFSNSIPQTIIREKYYRSDTSVFLTDEIIDKYMKRHEFPDRDRELFSLILADRILLEETTINGINFRLFEHDWTTEKSPELVHLNNIYDLDIPSTGIIEVVRQIVRYHLTPNYEYFQTARMAVRKLISSRFNCVLPTWLLALLPGAEEDKLPIEDMLYDLDSITLDEYNHILRTGKEGGWKYRQHISMSLSSERPLELDDWQALADRNIRFTTIYWAHQDNINVEFTEILLQKLLSHPNILLIIPLQWKTLLIHSKEPKNLLNTINELSENEPSYYTSRIDSRYTIPLDLPDELPFVPHMLLAIAHLTHHSQAKGNQVQGLIRGFFPSYYDWFKISEDTSIPPHLRLGPLILHLFYSEISNLINVGDMLVTLIRRQNLNTLGSWYWEVIGTFLKIRQIPESKETRYLLDQLLEVAGDDLQARYYLEPILDLWRRKAYFAPVTTGGFVEKWLGAHAS